MANPPKEYCVVDKNGNHYLGTKGTIVTAVCNPRLVGIERTLHYKVIGYHETIAHSYGASYSDYEARMDAVDFIFGKLPMFGFRIFREI